MVRAKRRRLWRVVGQIFRKLKVIKGWRSQTDSHEKKMHLREYIGLLSYLL